jgi:hypothetical protein
MPLSHLLIVSSHLVMDEEALVQALDSGRVASAGLDVYEFEPSIHPGLIANPNVMLLPHLGTWTLEVRSVRPFSLHPFVCPVSGRACSAQGQPVGSRFVAPA